jgi:hypothetical protein
MSAEQENVLKICLSSRNGTVKTFYWSGRNGQHYSEEEFSSLRKSHTVKVFTLEIRRGD